VSELPTCVGTSDGSTLLTLAGTVGTRAGQARRQDFRRVRAQNSTSGLPTHVGTSDAHSSRAAHREFRPASGLPTPEVTEVNPKCKRGARVSLKRFS